MVELSDKLEAAMTNAGTGEFDGNEIGGGETVLFMYGADAELLFRSIEPVLQEEKTAIGARAVLRWGEHGAPERTVILSELNRTQ